MNEGRKMTQLFEDGSPWCDTCKKRAVFSEMFGMCHSTDEWKFGVPPHLDRSGHEVTMKEWWDTPIWE